MYQKITITGLSFFMAIAFVDCASVTKQPKKTTILDVSQEDTLGGTGTSSADIRSMAERMAREISGLAWPENMQRVRIALTQVDNQTRFLFKENIIKDRLLSDLVENSVGTKIQYTENPAGADYFLSARITSLSKGSSEGVSDYLFYSFKLVNKDDTVVWMKSHETKKQGKTGVMYR